MRILFLLTQDLESPLGIGRVWPLARELVRRGHQVRIAALHSNWAGLTERRFEKDGVLVEYVAPMHVRKIGSQKQYYSPLGLITVVMRASLAMTKVALTAKVDIIQIFKPHPMNSLAGLLAKIFLRKPLCVDCDDLEMANLHFSGQWQQWGVRYFETVTPKMADHVTAHTSFLRDHFLRHGVSPEHFTYLPHGVDHNRLSFVNLARVEQIRTGFALEDKEIVAYIGSLSMPSHPVTLLVDAFQLIHAARPQTRLLIVGGGEEYQQLIKYVKDLHLDKAVIFTGRVASGEVPNYLHLADVQAEPVIDNTVGRSSLPLKMFESWGAGVPFVTGDVGDRRFVMGDPPAGIIVRPGDASALAEGVLQILENPTLANDLSTRGLVRADEYSWTNLAQRVEGVYEKVLARHDGNRR